MEDNTWVQIKTLNNTALYHILKTGSGRRQRQGHRVSCLCFLSGVGDGGGGGGGEGQTSGNELKTWTKVGSKYME